MMIRSEAGLDPAPCGVSELDPYLVGAMDPGGRESDAPVLETRINPRRSSPGPVGRKPTRPWRGRSNFRVTRGSNGPLSARPEAQLERCIVGRIIDFGDDASVSPLLTAFGMCSPTRLDRPFSDRRPSFAAEIGLGTSGHAVRRRC